MPQNVSDDDLQKIGEFLSDSFPRVEFVVLAKTTEGVLTFSNTADSVLMINKVAKDKPGTKKVFMTTRMPCNRNLN